MVVDGGFGWLDSGSHSRGFGGGVLGWDWLGLA